MLPISLQRRWPDSPPKKDVLQLWRRNGLKPGSSALYQRVLGVFFAYCAEFQLAPRSQLSAKGCHRFWLWYVRRSERCRDTDALRQRVSHPLRAYAWAVAITGHDVPPWKPAPAAPAWHQVVNNYVRHARDQRGLAQSGLLRDAADIDRFLAYLKRRRRHWSKVRLLDIDRFLLGLTPRLAPSTVGRVAYALRSWLRFLYATGRVAHDLAPAVVAPVRRRHDQPPRALPWPAIKKLLRAIEPTTSIGRRDRAQFLLMSAYGLGAAEVLQLRLEDIDWRSRRLHVVRRKTKTPITLPLLPEVARALGNYIRRSRPKPTACRQVFLSHRMPYAPFEQTGVLRHRVRVLAGAQESKRLFSEPIFSATATRLDKLCSARR